MDENGENNIDDEKEIENEEVEDVNINETDTLVIATDAIATYAGIAVGEVSGVYEMVGKMAGFTEAISGKKNLSRGIKVDKNDNSVKIDVNIIVEYGARIPDVAFEIQTKVKNIVENMTGYKVDEVNVHVQGVHVVQVKEDKPAEETTTEEEPKEE